MAGAWNDTHERAETLLRQGRAAEAAALLEAALVHAEADPATTRMLVRALAASNDLIAALDRQTTLIPSDIVGCGARGRDDALAAARLAQLAMFYDDAAQIAGRLVERDPGDVEAAHLHATLMLWLAGPEAAQAAVGGLSPEGIPANLLAEIVAFHEEPPAALIERLRASAKDTELSAQTRADLLLALVQYHDRAAEPDTAWELAEQGNMLAPTRQRQDWRGVLATHLQIHRETADVPRGKGSRQLYLLGTPRSGQSLVQSLLAAAPGVASAGERGALLQHVLFRTGEIASMAPAQRASFYAQLAEADRRGLARLVGEADLAVDKSPLHLAVAGSLARIHPDASFAAVLRDPADTALSIWLRSFPPIYDYANDLEAIFDQLDFALEALEGWREARIAIRLIDHAALVADPAGAGGALFDWLGLAWSDSYLKPENRTQPVPTFSAAQVRKPISPAVARGAAAYADHLKPFADTIDRLRDRTAALLAGGAA